MKSIRSNFLLAIWIVLVVITGCEKDEEEKSNDSTAGYIAPAAAPAILIDAPATIQNIPQLSMAYFLIQNINGLSALNSYFASIPAGATVSEIKSSAKTWTWTYNALNIWIEFIQKSTENVWRLYFMDNTIWLERTKIIEVVELTDGKSGFLKFYQYGNVFAVVTYAWEKVGSTTKATLIYNMPKVSPLFITISSTNGTCYLEVHNGLNENSICYIHVEWSGSGSGSWWTKDVNGGNYQSGTWITGL